jgi:steroid 5-alpha reductase family enzyme
MVKEVDTNLANELIPVTGFAASGPTVLVSTLAASVVLFAVVWAIHVKMRDAGIVDFAWGGSFVVTAWLAIGLVGSATPAALLVAVLATIWAIRLTAHMAWRHRFMEGEDSRYRAMREATGPSFWWKSLFKVYTLQAVIQWMVAAPLLTVALVRADDVPTILVVAGTALFAFGFVVEAFADYQLWSFKARPENRGRLMTSGLFAWSRHPNYFGETVLWFGIGLVAYAASGSLWAFAGPILLAVLLLKVSGVSLLDAHLARTKPGFDDWAAATPAFVPRPPRRRPSLASPGAGE